MKTEVSFSKAVAAWGLTRHQSGGGRWWVIAFALLVGVSGGGRWRVITFALLVGCLRPFFFTLHLFNHLYLDSWAFSHLCFSHSLPQQAAGGSEWVAGGCLIAGWGQPTHHIEKDLKPEKRCFFSAIETIWHLFSCDFLNLRLQKTNKMITTAGSEAYSDATSKQ